MRNRNESGYLVQGVNEREWSESARKPNAREPRSLLAHKILGNTMRRQQPSLGTEPHQCVKQAVRRVDAPIREC
jgi:hypothetical protein